MTLEQLRVFVAVAEREHMTQAARALNLTQSATSAAITALEARYATRLFDRVGRGIVLTEAGRLFLGEARAVLARASAAEALLTDLAGMKRGSLAIAASQTVANYWLPQIIHRYRSLYPGIGVSLEIGNTETVAASVRDGTAAIGFVEGNVDDPALTMRAVAADDLVLVVEPGHPWVHAKPDPVRDFRNQAWIFRERGSGTRSIFEAALAGLGMDPRDLNITLELPSNEAVRTAVEAGAGAAVMSRLVVAGSIRAGSLAVVDVALPKRQFLALRHKERHLLQAERAFHDLIAT